MKEFKKYVYLNTNPAWPDWTKVGITCDPKRRLGDYQTSSPHRDFKFAMLIETPYNSLLESCLMYHYFKDIDVSPREWVEEKWENVYKVAMDYLNKIKKNPQKYKNWLEEQQNKIPSNYYTYDSSIYEYTIENLDCAKYLFEKNNLKFKISKSNKVVGKSLKAREIAEILGFKNKHGRPDSASIAIAYHSVKNKRESILKRSLINKN